MTKWHKVLILYAIGQLRLTHMISAIGSITLNLMRGRHRWITNSIGVSFAMCRYDTVEIREHWILVIFNVLAFNFRY